MGTGADWKRLADRVTARRETLGIATRRHLADAAGLSYRLLGDIERGTRPVSEGTLAILEQALGWEPGSARDILRGGEPVVKGRPATKADSPAAAMRAVSEAYEIASELTDSGHLVLGNRLMRALGAIGGSLTSYAEAVDEVRTTPSPLPLRPMTPEVNGAGATVLGMALGRYMKKLRQVQLMTDRRAAELLGCPVAEIRLMEVGRVTFSRAQIRHLLEIYGVEDPDVRRECSRLADEARKSGWWTHHDDDILPSWFEGFLHLESCAKSIRTFEMQLIPGLLQTADYARSVMSEPLVDNLERKVQLRMERKRILERKAGPHLWAIIDETAISRSPVPADIMQAQIQHLIEMNERSNVVIQILPRTAKIAASAIPFSLFRFQEPEFPDVVYTEQLTSAIYLDRTEDIDPYIKMMDRVTLAALTPQQSAKSLCKWPDFPSQPPLPKAQKSA